MNDETAGSIKDGAKIIKRSTDVEIGDIDVPALMGSQRLNKSFTLAGMFLGPSVAKESLPLKDSIDARWTPTTR